MDAYTSLTESLSAREVALLFWVLAFTVWALTRSQVRRSALRVLGAFLQLKVLLPVAGLALYVSFAVFALAKIGLWDVPLLKDTVLWLLGGVATLVATGTAAEASPMLRTLATDVLKWTVLLEFVLNFYSLPLWAELITIPLLAVAVAVKAYAEYKPEYHSVIKPINGCLLLYGLLIIAVTVWSISSHASELLSADSLRSFMLPIALALGTLPYFYGFVLVAKYELAFLRLRWLVEDAALRSLAKRRLMLRFHVRLNALERWLNSVGVQQAATRAEVEQLLNAGQQPRRAA
jgi:hypothetical protein